MKKYGDELFIYAMAMQEDNGNEDAEDAENAQDESQEDDNEQDEDIFDKIIKEIERIISE